MRRSKFGQNKINWKLVGGIGLLLGVVVAIIVVIASTSGPSVPVVETPISDYKGFESTNSRLWKSQSFMIIFLNLLIPDSVRKAQRNAASSRAAMKLAHAAALAAERSGYPSCGEGKVWCPNMPLPVGKPIESKYGECVDVRTSTDHCGSCHNRCQEWKAGEGPSGYPHAMKQTCEGAVCSPAAVWFKDNNAGGASWAIDANHANGTIITEQTIKDNIGNDAVSSFILMPGWKQTLCEDNESKASCDSDKRYVSQVYAGDAPQYDVDLNVSWKDDKVSSARFDLAPDKPLEKALDLPEETGT